MAVLDRLKDLSYLEKVVRWQCYILFLLAVFALVAAFAFSSAIHTIVVVYRVFACLTWVFPLVAVWGCLRRRRRIVLFYAGFVPVVQIPFRAVYSIMAYTEGEAHDLRVTELVLAILTFMVGAGASVTCALLYVKLKSMDSSRRTIMVVGLNNAGKSALVQFLCPSTDDDVEDKDMWILPTPGLRLVQAMIDETYWKIWDMSGHGRYRRMWPYYYSYAQGIIWVVDSTNKSNIAIVKDEVEIMLKNPDVRRRKQPILFFCTKSDDKKPKDRMTADDLKEVLKLDRMLKGRHAYEVFTTSAMPKEGEGSTANIIKGLQWLKQKTRSFVDDL